MGKPNREFLALNKMEDGIMRKATTGTELTEYETARNKAISKVRQMAFNLSRASKILQPVIPDE